MKILIIDDEVSQVELLEGFLKKQGFSTISTTDPEKAVKLIKENHINLVISDYKMPQITGEELLRKIKNINPEINFILITAFGTIETAVNIMKLGAVDFIEKPVDLKLLLNKIQEIEEQILTYQTVKDIEEKIDINIPFKNPKILSLYKTIYKIAPKDINIFVTGESGTGKEVIAKTIHKLSNRAKYPFIAVNCAAIPENLFESELFGHEKGSFTGAISTKKGKFELANKGTIFLDEIGEMPFHLQGKLLRAIQERKIERIGSEKSINIDIRIIAATNRDIKDMVKQGEFREDLYYRLNVISIEMPPLRDRSKTIKPYYTMLIWLYTMLKHMVVMMFAVIIN
jgi:two-component system response regulator AtoC